MNIEDFRDYCLSFKGTDESLPFGGDTLVFKVKGKMFALTGLNLFESINLKCDPEKAVQLREQFEAVMPGYHMSKKHWNTIKMDGSIGDRQIKEWIEDSYRLVVAGLPKKVRETLQ